MQTNRDLVLDRILLNEGGYAERANEPGGAVNRGITFTEFKAWRKRQGQDDTKLTFDDLRDMTRQEAEDIYEADYLAPVRFDQLPGGVDYAMADFAVNSGVSRAIIEVSKKLGFSEEKLKEDSAWRPWRIAASVLWGMRTRPAAEVIDQICDARWELMKKSPNFQRFQVGWKNRVDRVRTQAKEMIGD